MRALDTFAAALIGLAGYPTSAKATADFFCLASAPLGKVAIVSNVGSEGFAVNLLLPPLGNPQLVIEGREVDLNDSTQTVERGWTVIRRAKTKRLVIAFRRTARAPLFAPGVDYGFCDEKNWKESCWGGQLRYIGSDGQSKVVDAVCGIG